MSEQARTELSCGEDGGSAPWSPLRKGWQSSRLFNQDVGLPPFLEPRDPRWMDVDWLQRSLAAGYWPGYVPSPMFVPYISGSMQHPYQKISKEQYKWRVSLDVAHFTSPEISLCVRDGFLEVAGRHEERQDEHGFIARCFTRKYRLPADIDATKIVSSLSVDGILTVEAPVPEASVPAAIIIPIKVETEVTEEKEEKVPDAEPESPAVPESPEFPSAEDREEEHPPETADDQAQPAIPASGLEQHEERRELEEVGEEQSPETPTGESHPSVPADGDGAESLQESSQQQESHESQEGPDASQQPEHKEPAADGEVQGAAGSGEAQAQEILKPEEPEPGTAPSDELQSQEMQTLQQQHLE